MAKFYLLFRSFLTILLVLGGVSAFAQDKLVTGKVTSKDDGSPIPGVNVIVKGTTQGSSTDADGVYKVSVAADATLSFSFIGYTTQDVPVGNQTTLNVVMVSDVTNLAEVVVVGYGQQEKKDVTGSIVAVGTKDLNRGVVSSPQDMMLGKVAGLSITSNDGAPGSGSTMRIRGTGSATASSDPLIIIDGFPVDNTNTAGMANPLATINPSDIETFTVLKDASATAIYGLRASNGVIIITTKKGKEGKPVFTYNVNVSASTPVKYFNVMTGDEFRKEMQTQLANGLSGLNAKALTYLGTANTNWQKQVIRTAITQDHNLGVSGSYKGMPYRVSYGYTDNEGLIKTTNFVRNSLNFNLNPSFLDGDLQVNASFKGSNTKQNFSDGGVIGAATSFDPTQVVRNGNTRWGGYFTETNQADTLANGQLNPNGGANTVAVSNPVALINQTSNTSNVNRGIGTLKLDYRLRFFPAIKLTANAGFDYSDSKGHNNAPNNSAFTATQGGGKLLDYTGQNKSRLLDLYANYLKTIGRHRIDATAGYSYQSFQRYGSTFQRNGQIPTIYTTSQDAVDKSGAPIKNPDGSTVQVPLQNIPYLNYLLSFFGRVNYEFADKYLVTASFRDDASSRFSKQNRFVYFPAAAVGWKINKENFMAGLTAVSDLKLRGSYGKTGNQDIILPVGAQNPSYPYLPLYQQSSSTAQYQFGQSYYNTQRPQAYDPNIKWETTYQADIGLDFGFLNNKITGSFDVYQKKTKDLINTIPVALGSNFSNYITTNVGNLTNRGIELGLRAIAYKTSDLEWNIGFNFAHNENKITKLLKAVDPSYPGILVGGISGGVGTTIQVDQVGHPVNSFFTFQQIYNAQGRPIEGLYTDKTGGGGDVTTNLLNKFQFHKPTPDYLMGINTRLTYKQWDFYASGRASIGNYAYNNNQSSKAFYSGVYNKGSFSNLPVGVHDTEFVKPQYYSSYYVQNASFFKMDNISIGYSFAQLFTQKIRARASFTVNNAFYITKYKGIDPDVPNNGIDNNIYPRPRVYLVGLNFSF